MSRIVGGTTGGRRLVTPRGRGTRPTSERVREALFSSLGGDLTGRSFLDLYAGSGAVGLEAASRGASPVHLVEHDRDALAAIRANAATLGLHGVHVHAEPVSRFLAHAGRPFDVVFLDPPYDDPVDLVLDVLVRHGCLAPGGTVVVERATRAGALRWPDGLVADRSRRYGDTTLWYGRRP